MGPRLPLMLKDAGLTAFVAGVEYAQTPLSIRGAGDVIGELNNAITQLGSGDAKAILDKTQGQLESIIG